MPTKKVLNPDWPRSASADFAQGIQLGETIYVSGQVAQAPDGSLVGEGDMDAQARQVFSNIEAVLALGGASLHDIARITTYVTDMSQYAGYAKVRKELFPDADIASATVSSPMLVRDGFLIEIEATAIVGSARQGSQRKIISSGLGWAEPNVQHTFLWPRVEFANQKP